MNKLRDGISARQLGALALSAAGLPIFRLCCRISWPWVLLGGLAAAGTISLLTVAINRQRRAFPLISSLSRIYLSVASTTAHCR